MKRKRYPEEQIAFALRPAEAGTPEAEVIRKLGVFGADPAGLGVSSLTSIEA